MKKETKIAVFAISAAAAAGTITAGLLSAVKLLSDMAVKKEVPKMIQSFKINVSGSQDVDSKLVEAATEKANELLKLCTQKVTIENRDGLKLTGYYWKNPNAKRIVIAMHGWRSVWYSDFSLSAKFMYDEGCSILFPEQRCHGDSEGEHIGFGVFERFDCQDWVDYVVKTEENDLPIYLCGVSMGATTVLMASQLNLSDRVKGIIADCGFTSPDEIWQHVMHNNLNTKAASTIDALSQTEIPVLFVHGDKDTFVPLEMTQRNYEVCNSPKDILIVEGAEHGLSFYVDPEAYKNKVIEFFKKYN